MNITVAITTRDRAQSLGECLSALAGQDYPRGDFEVIVADNGSADETAKICETMGRRFSAFRYLYDSRPGQLVGWHQALSAAAGDIMCFIDDDVRPLPTWLAGVAEGFSDPGTGLVTGKILPRFEIDPPDWLDCLTLGEAGALTVPALGLLDFGECEMEIPANFVWGSNFNARRDLIIEAGGFHPCAMPANLLYFYGDGEIALGRAIAALGHKAVYHPLAAVVHDIPGWRLELKSLASKFVTAGIARSFQTLRQAGGAFDAPSPDEVSAIADKYFKDARTAPPELRAAIEGGLWDGITGHLKAFEEDAEFRRWVLMEDYLDIDKCYRHSRLRADKAAGGDWRAGENRDMGRRG